MQINIIQVNNTLKNVNTYNMSTFLEIKQDKSKPKFKRQ